MAKEALYGSRLKVQQAKWRSRYKKRLFLANVQHWVEHGRKLDEMPTLKTYQEDLEDTLKRYGLTDAMHIHRTGVPWPRNPERVNTRISDVETRVAHMRSVTMEQWDKLSDEERLVLSRRNVFPSLEAEPVEAEPVEDLVSTSDFKIDLKGK